VKKYLRKADRFRELLLFYIHVIGRQPAQGTEITSIRFRNSFQQDRNVFAIQGQMVVVTRYHKSQVSTVEGWIATSYLSGIRAAVSALSIGQGERLRSVRSYLVERV
jgi:hypothetical protein